MDSNKILIEQFLETVNNQLKANDPPETASTLKRLKAEGYSDRDARYLIAACVAEEINQVLATNQPYNEARYIASLNQLPKLPKDEG